MAQQPNPLPSHIAANLDDAFTTLSNRVDPTQCSFICGELMGKKPKADYIRIYIELHELMHTDVLHEITRRLYELGLDIDRLSGNTTYVELLIKAI